LILPSEGVKKKEVGINDEIKIKKFSLEDHIGIIEKTVRERSECQLDYGRDLSKQTDTLNPLLYSDLLLDGIPMNQGQIMTMDRRFLEMFLDLTTLSLNSVKLRSLEGLPRLR
jgi:hypothetical protein